MKDQHEAHKRSDAKTEFQGESLQANRFSSCLLALPNREGMRRGIDAQRVFLSFRESGVLAETRPWSLTMIPPLASSLPLSSATSLSEDPFLGLLVLACFSRLRLGGPGADRRPSSAVGTLVPGFQLVVSLSKAGTAQPLPLGFNSRGATCIAERGLC